MTPEFIVAFVFGCVFVVALLMIAIFIPQPTNQQMFIFRVVLALAAAGVGAVIPGFFMIQGEVVKFTFQAGGALALFVLVYLLNPPSLIANPAKSALPSPKPPVKRKVPAHSTDAPVDSAQPANPTNDEGSSK